VTDNKTTIKSKASQDFVPIKEIRDGVVVLNNNSLRMIVMVSSLNFSLKSEGEQQAIINQYQSFLNSLDFSVQFLIQSRDLNIEPYLEVLRKKEAEQTDELLRMQTKEYVEFVREFVKATKIVNKNFYIVVPYDPALLGTKQTGPVFNFINKLFGSKQKEKEQCQKDKLNEYKPQLQQRVDTVIQGLSRTGVKTAPLNTEELIELFYTLYNPGETENIKLPQTQ